MNDSFPPPRGWPVSGLQYDRDGGRNVWEELHRIEGEAAERASAEAAAIHRPRPTYIDTIPDDQPRYDCNGGYAMRIIREIMYRRHGMTVRQISEESDGKLTERTVLNQLKRNEGEVFKRIQGRQTRPCVWFLA